MPRIDTENRKRWTAVLGSDERAIPKQEVPDAAKAGATIRVRGHSSGRSGKKQVDGERGTIDFRITTPDVDSFGDTVQPLGMDNTRFRKNPVVPWSHGYMGLPVARSLEENASAEAVDAVALFAREEDEFADRVFRFYESGFLNAVSIGFDFISYERIFDENGEWTGGFDIKEWGLYEYSPVVLPANENALVNAATMLATCAKSLGMDVPEGADSPLRRLFGAQDLLERYPELLEDDGLRKLVRREIEMELRVRTVNDPLPDDQGLRNKMVEDLMSELEALRDVL